MRWTAARRCGRALAPPSTPGVRPSPLVPCRRLVSGAVSGCALVPPPSRGLRPLPGQRGGEAARRWTAAWRCGCALVPPSTPGVHPSPLVPCLSPPGQQRGERLCASTVFKSRPPSAARASAWRGRYALDSGMARHPRAGAAFDSRPPSVASRFRRRPYSGTVSNVSVAVWTAARRGSHALDSGVAMRLCAGAVSRLEASARCPSSRSPPERRRGEQLRARQRPG